MRTLIALAVSGVLTIWMAQYERAAVLDLWGRIDSALTMANRGR